MNRLKELRLEKNLKQSDMANLLGCSQQMISKYEKGRTNLAGITEEKAAMYFECSVDYLKGLTDIKNPEKSILLISEFKKIGILKEGESISNEQIILLRQLLDANKSFFVKLSTAYLTSPVTVL